MSQHFDWEFYLAYYPDLKKNGLATQKQALWHYNRYGNKEGRVGNKNEVDFSERLSDMIEIKKNDKKDFIKHIRFWNWKAYKHSHDDLKNMSQDGLLKHVLTHGIQENRHLIVDKKNTALISKKTIQRNFDLLLPNDFNWNSYLSLNRDLPPNSENDAKCHYILHGNYEERLFGMIKSKIIIFHCGDFEIFEYLINKFPRILEMKLIITYYKDS